MNWSVLIVFAFCLFAVLFPGRSARFIEMLARYTYLPLLKRILKLQGVNPNEEEVKGLFAVRHIYIQMIATLIGGLALSTMNVFRFTRDLDFLVHEEDREKIHAVMMDLAYEKQAFDSEEIVSYLSPLGSFGQVDFMLARRKYSKAMMARAEKKPVFNESFHVKTLLPEDIIGLKIQAIHNDPGNRMAIDGSDIQQLLKLFHRDMDMRLVREYFTIFEKENLLDEWLDNIK